MQPRRASSTGFSAAVRAAAELGGYEHLTESGPFDVLKLRKFRAAKNESSEFSGLVDGLGVLRLRGARFAYPAALRMTSSKKVTPSQDDIGCLIVRLAPPGWEGLRGALDRSFPSPEVQPGSRLSSQRILLGPWRHHGRKGATPGSRAFWFLLSLPSYFLLRSLPVRERSSG